MTVEEMDNMFEVLYNNITSNQAPGLNAYEKSVFLTKAQDEILKNYFNPSSKGNSTQQGFDDSQKRQIDFSMLTTVYTIPTPSLDISPASEVSVSEISTQSSNTPPSPFGTALFDTRSNSKSVSLPDDIMMAINEMTEVTRGSSLVTLQVVPIRFDEYSRLMCKPYKRPLKFQAWRLINSDSSNKADLIVGPGDSLNKYILRYVRRPKPIIVSLLDGLTIEGYYGATSSGTATKTSSEATQGLACELDPILHNEILQRAVELAKIAWTSTGQDNFQAVIEAGQRSE